MKKATIIIALVLVAGLAGCTTSKSALADRRAQISWTAFCNARGHEINDDTRETTNEYLDTWLGSVDEENAFIMAGIEPY